MLGGVSADMQDKEYLASRGVRVALQGHQPFSAAVKATYDTLKALREGTKPSALQGIASSELMAKVTRDGDYKSWTEKFLGYVIRVCLSSPATRGSPASPAGRSATPARLGCTASGWNVTASTAPMCRCRSIRRIFRPPSRA